MAETNRYTSVAILLHWTIAILIVMLIFVGWRAGDMAEALRAGSTEFTIDDVRLVFNWHKTFGLLVLALSLFRLVWRFMNPVPAMPEGMKPWEKTVARLTHFAFYVLIIGMPILGWLTASASTAPSFLFNNPDLPIPEIAPDNQTLHEVTEFLHGRGAWVIIVLLVLHAGAAIKHHVIDKDDVLARMLPFLRRKNPQD
ncbi:MAG: cytochrome B [Maricaulis sp.]|jgi:cytochrome b561|nr:cytochrome B [Maricaulis sp.]HAQ35093.1 cytochrome B [Alphaproteobacteria bacterium]